MLCRRGRGLPIVALTSAVQAALLTIEMLTRALQTMLIDNRNADSTLQAMLLAIEAYACAVSSLSQLLLCLHI